MNGSLTVLDANIAFRLCRDVDENDTPYLALCLHLNARLWTVDKELKAGLAAKGFNRFVEW